MFWHLVPQPAPGAAGDSLYSGVSVPTLPSGVKGMVAWGTFGVVVLGFAWVCSVLLRVWGGSRRGGKGVKKDE